MALKINRLFWQKMIKQHLRLSKNHLTPEIGLHLITPETHLWKAQPENSPFHDPFWAFYWPGGQALTRYILDHPNIVKNQGVLDLGCGCGSVSIAAKLCGASQVVANDIDPVALVASELNFHTNSVNGIFSETRNLLSVSEKESPFDVIFMGDMFYDPDFANIISRWLSRLPEKTTVFIGDPGRLAFNQHSLKSFLVHKAEYAMDSKSQLENNGLTHCHVWQLGCR